MATRENSGNEKIIADSFGHINENERTERFIVVIVKLVDAIEFHTVTNAAT